MWKLEICKGWVSTGWLSGGDWPHTPREGSLTM